MKLLALDTATNACSVALWDGRGIAAHRALPMERGHAEALMPMVREVLAAASCAAGIPGLDAIAVTVGPGAFTGVRIGLAAARAMGLAAGLPVLGLTTLEVVASSQDPVGGALLVAIDSKRADLYAQAFAADGAPCSAPAALLPARLVDLLPGDGVVSVVGDASAAAAAALAAAGRAHRVLDGPASPDAAALARLAASRWRDGLPSPDAPPPRPLYLRPPDVSPPPTVS